MAKSARKVERVHYDDNHMREVIQAAGLRTDTNVIY